jgi:hypothetical protein
MKIDLLGTSTFVVVGLLLWLLARAANKEPERSAQGATVFKYGGGYKALGWVCVGIACCVAFAFAINTNKADVYLVMGILFLVFLAMGSWLLLTVAREWVECDEEKVRSHGVGGKVREIAWREVSSVKLDRRAGSLSLAGPNGAVKLAVTMKGFNTFVEILRKKLDSRLYSDAFR